ncbi:hypothetical protein Q4F19_07900 [Sphingomonas sp. BIUV-7]|uniref:Uncharacterized protein n=1 Tax=Sphingomonas natans TaxID=3063330 RepID=A0ABT8Y7L5_9SPHN|nr:hypothetical protein [Sphingomonas sp. BIUV-7]MDO6414302.1 hypothetical protein [Sphingomonas sp. BIUV-7]
MQHDVRLRAAARAIFDACYPSEEWSLVPFDEAERCGTLHYRQAVEDARQARLLLSAASATQLALI